MRGVVRTRQRAMGVMLCGWIALSTAVMCQEDNTLLPDRDEAYEQMRVFTEVLMHIRRQYVIEKSYRDVIYGGLHGMLQGLDPHSDFLDAEAYESMKEDTSSKFGGVGIHIGMRDGVLAVIAPMEDTPAFRAGILAGDLIVHIDDQKTQGMSLQDAVRKLRGIKGEKVTIGVRRKGEDDVRNIGIVRDDIKVPSVKAARIVREGIGYVRITQFSEPTAEALQHTVEQLKQSAMKALVLDLRDNHGGLLRSATDVAQMFLEEGRLIVITRGRPNVYEESRTIAKGDSHFLEFPMAVLVNGASASASEIVAGALRDNGRAILLGETTFGKASVQSLINLKADNKAAIRITVAHYYTPSGKEIHNNGIDPDIVVACTPQEWHDVSIRRAHAENPKLFSEEDRKKYEHVVDRQMERALDILQGILVLGRRESAPSSSCSRDHERPGN